MHKTAVATLMGLALVSLPSPDGYAAPVLTRGDLQSMTALRAAVPHLPQDEVRAFFQLAASHVGRSHEWQTLSTRTPGNSFLSIRDRKCVMVSRNTLYEVISEFGTFQDQDVTPVAFAHNPKFSRGYLLTLQGSQGKLVGTRFVGGARKFKQAAGPHDGFNRTTGGIRRIYLR